MATILVIEDDPDVRQLIQLFLGDVDKHAVKIVAALEDVEAYLSTTTPDIILADQTLDGFEHQGWEIVRRLRQNDQTRAIPIIAMSGHNSSEYRQAAAAAGCDEFIRKPLNIADLRLVLQRHLGATSKDSSVR